MSDLRSFLARVRAERPADLIEIDREVDGRFETAAILTKLEAQQRSPILFFKRVAGTALPVVTNVCGSMGRIAFALGCPLKDVSARYDAAIAAPIKPMVTLEAPVQEIRATGLNVDLRQLPGLVYHEQDSEKPYITAAIGVARDPDTGHENLSVHRLMVIDRATTAIFIEPGKHLDEIFQKFRRAGHAMPIAFFIGAHPTWLLGAVYSGPLEEYDVIGGLLGEPLPVVECITQAGLFVPARAEIVLEGLVEPRELVDEGPFGEWPGYSTGVVQAPVFHVTAMTMRHQAIFQDVVSGQLEHLTIELPAIEHRALSRARAAAAGVTAFAVIAPFTSAVALEKASDDEPKRVMDALLPTDIQAKHLIVVDADVDVRDPRRVFRAVGLNTQPARDVYIFPDERGTLLDPSCTSAVARTSKMGIDATRRLQPARAITQNRLPADVLARVDVTEILRRRPSAGTTTRQASEAAHMRTITAKTKEGLPVAVETAPAAGPDWRDDEAFRSHYRSQGYAVARGLIPPALADEAVASFQSEVKPYRGPILRQLSTRMEEHRFSTDGHMTNPILSVQDLSDEQFTGFRRSGLAVLTHEHVQRVLRNLMSEPVTCVESMYFESSARGTITHADGHFMDASVPGAMIAAWYALEDIHSGAGRFYLLPESHLLGTDAPCFAHLRSFWEQYEALSEKTAQTFHGNTEEANAALRIEHARLLARGLAGISFYAPVLEKGDVVFWSSRVLHGSLKPTEPHRSRSSLTAHYIARSQGYVQYGAPAELRPREVNGMPVHHLRPVRGAGANTS
jgi:UbiD family decarboxylase